ncbi:MAG TPA: SCO1664 family protein [Actinomycetota bacterium]|nr:SCO1664 family protein [Actinomycetota bacterium]
MSGEPVPGETPSPGETLALLADGEVRPLGLLPGASNYTFLAEVCHEDRTALAVYKPRAGEAPLWDFPEGTLCLREVAAFVLSSALGWPLVPPTIMRDGPHGPGSVQLFVHADVREHYFTMRERRREDFKAAAAFDVVANNADRKAGHCLLDGEARIWLVDHGVCFNAAPKLRTVIWDFVDEPVPDALLPSLRRVAGDLREGPLREAMLALLAPDEVDQTARRAEALAAAGRFPSPGSGRPYPWPPV